MNHFSSINPNSTFAELLELEQKEFVLHQHVDYLIYKKKRLLFIEQQADFKNKRQIILLEIQILIINF